MKKVFLYWAILLPTIFFSCSDELDIVKDYEEQIVLFLVLDNRNDKQMVKIQKLQNNVNLSQDEKIFKNLSVKLVDTYGVGRLFKDTLISGLEHYNTLYLDSLDLKEGVYSLFVNADGKSYAWSNVTVRGPQMIYITSEKEYYKVQLAKTAASKGFLVKPFMYFNRPTERGMVLDRMEVPATFYVNGKDTVESYQIIQKSDITDKTEASVNIRFDAITYTTQKIMGKYKISNADITGLKIFSFSYDWNLFEYLSSYGGYQDEYSVRLDKPNFSNVILGNGIFGTLRADSVEIKN